MKILHLFSNWKWTGPADPTLNLCKGLEKRGHDVTFAYRKPPIPLEDSIEKRVLQSGVKATDQFRLDHSVKVYQPSFLPTHLRDILNLTRYLRQEKFDILNVHHTHGHLLGGIAARRSGHPVVVIRSDHKRDSLKPSLGNRLLISQLTDGMITFSERARRDDSEHFGLPLERVQKVSPALDLGQYDPRAKFKDMKPSFGIEPREIVIGMIARYQKYRRTAVFLEAVKTIVKEFPNVKILLVGRSGQIEQSVIQPMRQLGVKKWVVLGGYQTKDYLATLACMDIFVFLMAGSDGTARALREAMAMGKPVIVANRGMLPELVEDGISGLVVNDTAEELARAALRLLQRPELREALGKAAYQRAHQNFQLDRQVEAVESFYQAMMKLGCR
ncbi:MAG TPA: glycosyltransferase family 4 protein [Thermodesulfobacteriota bacterium]|nr:glycosyltransferase family 4 protein [Thermodesulfobacteriota bacterium]